MTEREKVSGFRLPQETLDKLDELITLGVIKNRTRGIIYAINCLYSDEQFDQEREPFLFYLNRILMHEEIVRSFKQPDAVFPVRLFHGNIGSSIIDRLSPTHMNIRFNFGKYGNTEIVIDVCQNVIINDDDDDDEMQA